MRLMLVTVMLLVVARQSRTFQLLTLAWAARCMGNGEGTQLTQIGQSDIPYHMTSCSAYEVGSRRRRGGAFGVMMFVFPSHHYM